MTRATYYLTYIVCLLGTLISFELCWIGAKYVLEGDVVHTYTPSKPGKYTAFVFNGAYDLRDDWTPDTPLWQSDADALNAMQSIPVPFTVEAKNFAPENR